MFDKAGGELLGGHVFGDSSEELIHEVALAMQARMTREELVRSIPIHPSQSEAVFGAALSAQTRHEESCCG